MNSKLQELFNSLLLNPCDDQDTILANVAALKQLLPGSSDFSDEYFRSLSPLHRHMAYVYIRAIWPQVADETFRRRLVVEDDPACMQALMKMLKIVVHTVKVQSDIIAGDPYVIPKKEQTANYQQALRDSIFQYLKNPKQVEASIQIMKLKPTDTDFSDEFLDSMTVKDRLEVYLMLLMWCGSSNLKRTFEHRSKIETNKDCMRIITMLLPSLQRLN